MAGVILIDPPSSHREGPIFLNVLRVLDIPDALGLVAPRELRIDASQSSEVGRTAKIFSAATAGAMIYSAEGRSITFRAPR